LKSTRLDESLQSAIKETKIVAKLIQSGSTCLVCFVTNPFLIEWHHVGGRKHSNILLPLCANCHLLASKHQTAYGISWLEGRTERESVQYVIQDLEFLLDRLRNYIGTN